MEELKWPLKFETEVFDDGTKRSAGAPTDTASPVGGVLPPTHRPPEIAPRSPEKEAARQARIAEITSNDDWKKDMRLAKELGGLMLGEDPQAQPIGAEPERAPITLRPESIPQFNLPPHLEEAREAVESLRAVCAYSEVPVEGVQQAINHALALITKTPPIENMNEAYRLRTALHVAGQKAHGAGWAAILADTEQAINMLSGEHKDLATIVNDPRVMFDLPMVEALATLGAKSRHYYTRRYGTISGSKVF